jgi:hypothetical protein
LEPVSVVLLSEPEVPDSEKDGDKDLTIVVWIVNKCYNATSRAVTGCPSSVARVAARVVLNNSVNPPVQVVVEEAVVPPLAVLDEDTPLVAEEVPVTLVPLDIPPDSWVASAVAWVLEVSTMTVTRTDMANRSEPPVVLPTVKPLVVVSAVAGVLLFHKDRALTLVDSETVTELEKA